MSNNGEFGASYNVYTGFWINRSQSIVYGSSLTLDSNSGNVLIAFLALFVQFTGEAVWEIFCYTVHSLYEHREVPRSGFHRQMQVTLRNSNSPLFAAIQLLRANWIWRKRPRDFFGRAFWLAILAIANFIGFIVAGLLSARVVNQNVANEVLLVGSVCGNLTSSSAASVLFNKQRVIYNGKKYADLCYGPDVNPANCNAMVKQQIVYSNKTNLPCPFGDDICIAPAFQLDTGIIDSQEAFGINSGVQDQVRTRVVVTCAPIKTVPYMSVEPKSPLDIYGVAGDTFYHYAYGPSFLQGKTQNWTWDHNKGMEHMAIPYTIDELEFFAGSPSEQQAWAPIPALKPADADVGIYFLSANSVQFIEPTDDPLFSAHQTRPNPYNASAPLGYYADSPAGVLACAYQHQVCNPAFQDRCTTPADRTTLVAQLASLEFSERQLAVFWHLFVYSTSLNDVIYHLGTGAMQAIESLTGLVQYPLPANQWQKEIERWANIGLAGAQVAVVEWASWPSGAPDGSRVEAPGPNAAWMCRAQKVRSRVGDYSTFSVLGVFLIIGLGVTIIAVNFSLEHLVSLWQQRSETGRIRRMRWILDSEFQLLRLAYEGAGLGQWIRRATHMPITRNREKLGTIDMIDPDNARLAGVPDGGPTDIINGYSDFEGDNMKAPA